MEEGCWQCAICVTAETLELHTEKDATYTIITVTYKNDLLSAYCFWIQTNHSHNIVLDMNKEIVFMFSLGLLLKHRQKCNSRVAADFLFILQVMVTQDCLHLFENHEKGKFVMKALFLIE